MILFLCAALTFACLLVSFRQDRRQFRNAVLLGLTLVLLGLAGLDWLGRSDTPGTQVAPYVLPVLVGVTALVLPAALVANGLTMVRREGRALGNLLSLLAGIAMFLVLGFFGFALASERPAVVRTAVLVLLVAGYVSFVFASYLVYAFLYGRIRVRPGVDYVVVLGCGLVRNEVPKLLASRLDRGLAEYRAEEARGGTPKFVTSGGQGPDEDRPEAVAMAEYLVARGVPDDRILREDRSTTTEENLTFSRALMEADSPGHLCVVVTNNYHAFRAALVARRTGVNGQVVGARTARYFWPSATIREFAAIWMEHWRTNFSVCAALLLAGTAWLLTQPG
ncbi:YdcF family protein [Streptomyces sp. NPDC060194]|uniref:YdcF family protein n=1 Tax=Streptomyces sp. NPDC060194 TaxID=3347069 RepID=UPI0036620739